MGSAPAMSNVAHKPRGKVLVKTERPRLHKVILVNDDYTPREFVVSVLKAEFRMAFEAIPQFAPGGVAGGLEIADRRPAAVGETQHGRPVVSVFRGDPRALPPRGLLVNRRGTSLPHEQQRLAALRDAAPGRGV